MVFFAPFVGSAALFLGLVAARPMPDSAIGNEVPVSAPNGTPISETSMAQATGNGYGSSSNYGSSGGYGSDGGSGSYGGSGDYSGGGYASMSSDASYPMYTTTSTSSAMNSYSTSSYGSGSSNWGGSGYDSCVQQCMASYGSMGSYSPPPTTTMNSMDNSGSGVTHTIIVAPTQGVLRYVPFAVNASVGDTVLFMWGANNHTVTKSSELQLCNKTSDAPFATGEQNKGFTFTQVVNNTDTTFFYCGTPGHCEKGMFGMINPPTVGTDQSGSVATIMPSMMSNSSSMSAMASYANMMTQNNTLAANWGSSMNMSAIPDWAQEAFAENVLFTRTFLAANPEVLNADGSVSLSNLAGNPAMIPQDITQVGQAATTSSSSVAAPAATSAASAASTAAAITAAKNANGARSLGSSGVLVGAAALLAALVAL